MTLGLFMVRLERIRALVPLQGWIDLKGESMATRLLHLRRVSNVRLDQTDVSIALKDIAIVEVLLVDALVLAVIRVVPFEWNTCQTVSCRLSIHDVHDFLEHLLVFCVDLAYLIVTPIDSTRAQVRVGARCVLVHSFLKIYKIVHQLFTLLSLHKHGRGITG